MKSTKCFSPLLTAEVSIFKIGSTDNGFRAIGIPLIKQLAMLAPNVQLVFLNLNNRDMYVMLEKGELDLAILSHLATPERLHFKPLYQENYVCAMRENHPILEQAWNVANFCQYHFVLGSFYGGGLSGATDKVLEKLGYERKVALSVQSFALIPDVLKQTDYLAVVPEHLILPSDQLVIKPLPFEPENYTKVMAWHERTHLDIVQKWFRKIVAECVGTNDIG